MNSSEKSNKLSAYIGLAQRAGAVLFGEDIICERLKHVKVVLIDDGAPEKYVQRLKNRVKNSPVYLVNSLCERLHKDNVKSIAITNEGLANAINDLLR